MVKSQLFRLTPPFSWWTHRFSWYKPSMTQVKTMMFMDFGLVLAFSHGKITMFMVIARIFIEKPPS